MIHALTERGEIHLAQLLRGKLPEFILPEPGFLLALRIGRMTGILFD